MSKQADWQMFRDVRATREYAMKRIVESADAGKFAANVGDAMSAALAAAGTLAIVVGGQTPCETDYLAAQGAVFPADVPLEELERFNRETLSEEMDEAAEHRRYEKIAGFWRRSHV